MRVAALILALGALGACTTMGPSPRESDYQRLARDCTERSGILTPTGANTGRDQVDYACRITSGGRVSR